ncbi:glycerol-3-phosphate 1-O-acyltransferase PlsY [Streptococcus sp. sy018]|uniref:glycerol-3-phosphate 1-O-acyltransferase PlsY n=1 Tax=Streptococcus sp. sy018 TaxID=2600147 RepID=UPI0011B652D4|nr:glycerol-3-phosphate 1-O-acyltransferase PlsY [Streptococcus sp. sy018]TWS95398.1 glycerol-3-phosphate 1-O-acyltransferase PlsY [Streptococcus sp. sy018]
MNTLIYLLIAYLLGSIPTGLWIGQKIYGKNLREFGSGNTGTTNTFRILGKKAGTVTLLVDLLKGTLATLIPVWFGGSWLSPIIIGFFAVLGHTFPIFAQFKGGKAVATSAGVILGFAPQFFLYLLLVFLSTLYLTSMISYASITVAIAGILGILIFPIFGTILSSYDLIFSLVIILMSVVILLRHKDNMKRIATKQENLVPFGLNLTKQKPKS